MIEGRTRGDSGRDFGSWAVSEWRLRLRRRLSDLRNVAATIGDRVDGVVGGGGYRVGRSRSGRSGGRGELRRALSRRVADAHLRHVLRRRCLPNAERLLARGVLPAGAAQSAVQETYSRGISSPITRPPDHCLSNWQRFGSSIIWCSVDLCCSIGSLITHCQVS